MSEFSTSLGLVASIASS